MEMEENKSIPFLDVIIAKKEDGTLRHQVFRNKNYKESYLHADSYDHPAQKFGVHNALVVRALIMYDANHLNEENKHLTTMFKNMGFKDRDTRKS